MKLVFIGLSITSSWGNGHATTYRALLRALAARGHEVTFLERDAPWYAANRDLPSPSFCEVALYDSVGALESHHGALMRNADVTVVGSYVPEGIAVGNLVQRTAAGLTAFYDIDTPVTLSRLGNGLDYLDARQIPRYDLYLSFTGGPTLERLRRRHGARCARALYCSVDPDLYYPDGPDDPAPVIDLGYLGTYSSDRQPVLDRLMLDAARRWPVGSFVVAGPQYPDSIAWPANVTRVCHVEPADHRGFYTSSRFTLNVTRQDMVTAGYSPSVRLFEAAACRTPIISDTWPGLETLFTPGREILLSRHGCDTLEFLRDLPEPERRELGERARARVLAAHTAAHRAVEFEQAVEAAGGEAVRDTPTLTARPVTSEATP
jgi:spore maturation protein CgeB